MANWLREELEQAEKVIANSIDLASSRINENIRQVGEELASQRTLTKEELERLIVFASTTFATVLDERIDKAKTELASLVTDKLAEVRNEMSETATMQKRSAIRNAAIGIFAAIAVAVVSTLYRNAADGGLDMYSTFRTVLLALVAGHSIWLVARFISNYLNASKLKKDAVFYAAQFVGFFRIKGLGGHLAVMLLMAAVWVYLSFFWGR